MEEIRLRGLTRSVSLKWLFEDPEENSGAGILIKRLQKLGVNPAGPGVMYQEFNYDNRWRHWTELFNFDTNDSGFRTDLSPAASDRVENTYRPKVVSEICNTLFSKSYFGFEAAA